MYQINQRVFGNGAATEIYQQNPYSNVQINTEQTKQNVNPIDTNQTNNNTMTSLSGTNDNFHSLLFQVLQNPKMTNEERLIFILKNNKNIRLHPYIMQVLNNRENMKKGFRYGASNYNYIKNGNNSTTKSQNGYANGGSDDSNDSKYKKKSLSSTQSSTKLPRILRLWKNLQNEKGQEYKRKRKTRYIP